MNQFWLTTFSLKAEHEFVKRMDQNVAKYCYFDEKMVMAPVCMNGRSYLAIQAECVLYCSNKDKGNESLPSTFDM